MFYTINTKSAATLHLQPDTMFVISEHACYLDVERNSASRGFMVMEFVSGLTHVYIYPSLSKFSPSSICLWFSFLGLHGVFIRAKVEQGRQ